MEKIYDNAQMSFSATTVKLNRTLSIPIELIQNSRNSRDTYKLKGIINHIGSASEGHYNFVDIKNDG